MCHSFYIDLDRGKSIKEKYFSILGITFEIKFLRKKFVAIQKEREKESNISDCLCLLMSTSREKNYPKNVCLMKEDEKIIKSCQAICCELQQRMQGEKKKILTILQVMMVMRRFHVSSTSREAHNVRLLQENVTKSFPRLLTRKVFVFIPCRQIKSSSKVIFVLTFFNQPIKTSTTTKRLF